MVLAVRGNFNDLAAQRPRNGRVFALGVNDDNVVVGGQSDVCDGIFHCHGFTGTADTQVKSVRRNEPLAVTNQEILGNGVDTVVQTTGVLNLLRTERHENSAALGGQRPQSMDTPQAIREDSIQAILLLVS